MRHAVPVLICAIAVAACGGQPAATTTVAPTTTSSSVTPTTSTPATTTLGITEPATTTAVVQTLAPELQRQVDWFIALLNGAPLDESDYNARFAQVFLDQLTAAQFTEVVDQIKAAAPFWQQTEVIAAQPSAGVVRIAPESGDPAFALSVSIDADGRINGLYVQPADPPQLDDPPQTAADAAARIGQLGRFGYVVADVAGDECTVRMGQDPDVAVPLGSMFKLYVLGAVVDAVTAGTISWDQEVEIVDRYRSLPSGIVQDDPPGSTRTVRELAELMISISDNTAADHLAGLVGRAAVEQALLDYGHSNPALNRPFLTTRELFVLKLADPTGEPGTPGRLGTEYASADETERRRILEDEVDPYPLADLDIAQWTAPIAVDDLEWFASPMDLCRSLTRLEQNNEAVRILSINPGIPDTDGLWTYLGYKGGSEPGLLGMAWYRRTQDGGISVVSGAVWNSDQLIDETEAALLLGALRDLT